MRALARVCVYIHSVSSAEEVGWLEGHRRKSPVSDNVWCVCAPIVINLPEDDPFIEMNRNLLLHYLHTRCLPKPVLCVCSVGLCSLCYAVQL